MSLRQEGILLVGAMLILSFIFQLQMKLLASNIAPELQYFERDIAARLMHAAIAAFGYRLLFIAFLAGTLFLLWLLILTRLELSIALPLASIALVVNAVGAGLFLNEAMTPTRVIGIVTVAVGIGLVLKS
jgi:hypothetical protein